MAASDKMKKWHVDRARETLAIRHQFQPIGGHEPHSPGWYAYLLGRVEVQMEALIEAVEEGLPAEMTCKANLGGDDPCTCRNGIGCANVPVEKW